MSSLDILAHVALDCDDHLMRISNDDFRTFVDDRLATKLAAETVELYHKLLATPRTRAIAADALDVLLDEDHRLRYQRYQESTHRLARRCVDELLARVPVDPKKIAAIVTNTTVGGTIPNLSSVVGNRLGSSSGTRVADLGYMGCATSLLALEHIETLLGPGEVGVVLSSEVTSAMVNLLSDETTSAVANTVFGDGVGAFLVARRPHRHAAHLRVLGHAGSVLTDDEALAAITYRPNAVYHEIHLQPTIPAVAGRGVEVVMRSLVRHYLSTPREKLRYALRRETPQWQRHVDYAVLHAAGKKVLDTLHHELALTPRQSSHNLGNFATNSNTSSASLYYGLAELTRTATLTPGDTLLLLGYGSGFLTRGMIAEVRGSADMGLSAPDGVAPLVKLSGVSYSYPSPDGPVTVLSNLSLTVHPGEFVAVIGPSGSGKSTLLNILGNLVVPEGGGATVAGIDLTAMDVAAAERYRQHQIAFVFQFFNLFPTLTAEENVQLSLEAMEPAPADVVGRTQDALQRVGLGTKMRRFPAQLSGGEQQRVAIARALARRAPLILADEPTGNLDATTAVTVLDVLDECRRTSGAAMVLITHDLDVARRADRALRLSDGRLEPVSFEAAHPMIEPLEMAVGR